jgi:hypothetical protein
MLWGLARIILFLFTLTVFVPWITSLAPDDLDWSYEIVLQWAHQHAAQFGRDIVFTHGPWGFAFAGHFPNIFPWVVAVWTFFAVAFFLAICRLADFATPNRWLRLIWMLLVIDLAGTAYAQMQDVRLMAICWLALPLYFYADDRTWEPRKLLLAAAMALASLMKFSIFFAAAPVLAVITIDQVVRRQLPSLLLVFLAAFLVFWLAAQQHLENLWLFLHTSWQVSMGYSQGESTYLPSDAADVALFLAVAGTLLAATQVFRIGQKIPFSRRLLESVGLAGVLWIMFKAGYVRHDLHEVLATSSLSLAIAVYAAVLWARSKRWFGRIFVVLLSVLGVFVAMQSASQRAFVLHRRFFEPITAVPARSQVALQWALGSPLLEQQIGDLKAATPMPRIDGPIDIYSFGQGSLILSGSDYRPRPVFQSYLTYTAALGRLNADFLRSSQSPDTILFEIQAIDHHYRSQEDALSWPELLSRYQPVWAAGPRLVLRKLNPPGDCSIVPIEQTTGQMGHWLAVPDSPDPIWATIRMHPTLAGRLMSLVYKTPPILLGVKTRSGDVESFRLLSDVAEGGFLLSPCVGDHYGFASLYSDDFKKQIGRLDVVEMAISSSKNPTTYSVGDQYDVTFSRLIYPHKKISAVPGIAEYFNMLSWLARVQVIEGEKIPELEYLDQGKVVLPAAAPNQMFFPISSGATKFSLSFGMLDSSFNDPVEGMTDGVRFQVFTVDQLGKNGIHATLVWSRFLDPGHYPADRGVHTARITLPQSPPAVGVLLQTIPGPQHNLSWSYWADLETQ